MQETVVTHSEDNFKEAFKYYKRKQPPPDLSQVLDVDSLRVTLRDDYYFINNNKNNK